MKVLMGVECVKTYLIMGGKSLSGGGGAERRFLRLFEKVKKDTNIDIELVTNRQLYSSANELGFLNSEKNISIYEEDALFKSRGFFLYIIKYIIKEKPDVVHLVLIQKSLVIFYIFLFLFRKILDIKVVGTVASYLYAKEINLSLSEKILYKIFIGCTDQIDSLYPSIVLKNDKVNISPGSFTDYQKFHSKEKEDIIVFAGRLIEDKNPELFIKSINEIINIRKDSMAKKWEYHIMGDGPLKEELINYVNRQGLDKNVIFSSGDISTILSMSKVFVSLQPHENYPSQSVLEAIASKNYIIATDVGDTRKFVNDEYSHLIQSNIESLSDAIIEVINDNIDLEYKVECALNDTKMNHNIEVFSDYLIELWNVVTVL